MHVIWTIVGALANVAVVLLVAPLAQGVLRKITARIQSRQGPPVLQPYFDLLKLLGKEDIESGEYPLMQRFAAYLSLTIVLTIACFVPMGFAVPMGSAGDAILLIYLLTLSGICTLLAGLAAGSTYSLLGISREMMTMITLEPLFAIALIVGAVHTNSLRLDSVLGGSVYRATGAPIVGPAHARSDIAVIPGLRATRAVRYFGSGNRTHGRTAHGVLRSEAGAVQVFTDGEADHL